MPDNAQTPFDQGLFLVHLNRGKEYFEQRNFGEAANELDQARRMRPTDETVLNLLGLTYFKQERYKEADGIYSQLIEVNPNSDVLHFNQGLICFKLGALDRAESSLLRALEIFPDNPKVNFYLGNIYEKKKQYYNAIFQYRKAGANIMVKRVQSKIEADRRAKESPADSHTSHDTEDTLPPPRMRNRSSPIEEDQSSAREFKVTVDHIDRNRFLSALQQSPLGSAPPRQARAKPGAKESKGPPAGPAELVPAQRTVIELTDPVVPDISLADMARRKAPTSVSTDLFASPRARSHQPGQTSDDEDTVELGASPPETAGHPETKSFQRSTFVAEDERETTHLYSRLRRRDDIFRYLANNLMEVNFSGKVFIKQGTIYSYSGNLTFWVKPQRGESVSPLVIVSGTGKLLLSDRQRDITVMRISGEEVFIEPSHLLACQETLSPRYAIIKKEGQPETRFQVLSIEGSGMLALSVATSPLVLNVIPGFPVNVASANIISWSGDLTPSIVVDEALADLMYPHRDRALNLRLEGSGKVMMEKLTA